MKLLALITLTTVITATLASDGGFNEYVVSCKKPNFIGDCKTISLINKLDTCIDLPDHSSLQYGHKGSSFQVNGHMACRFFKSAASLACPDPKVDSRTGLTGAEGQRATAWLAYPGFTSWNGQFNIQSFLCTSTEVGGKSRELPKVVTAECGDTKEVDYACRGKEMVPPGGE